ncbi:alcohol dehydrogenase catalytic domain-containing protein [Pseudonocardia sp. RS010]|uniref:alcohol dehydrogenase catalytic domain-containing protein n=1 Tax=Pseudonocardia sp. RS010 TaxID=3385979 RepID=UPI0039A35607
MRAVVYRGPGQVVIEEVPEPVPSPDRVLVRVRAAGVCQTDVHIRRGHDHRAVSGLVLGHEIAGTVEAAPDGSPWAHGTPVAVYPMWACGRCPACVAGRRQACVGTGGRTVTPPTPGVSAPGGMADLVSVPESALAGADGLDPAVAAVLADAVLTPYSSIRAAQPHLSPGAVALVVGVGGLGSTAVAVLRATTAATVVAVDLNPAALAAVADLAHHTLAADAPDVAGRILELTGGAGVDVVLDFVGAAATLELAAATVAPFGAVRVTGMSEGELTLHCGAGSRFPRGVSVTERTFSGSRTEFDEVLGLAASGTVVPTVTRHPLDDAVAVLDALERGEVRGRAVLTL